MHSTNDPTLDERPEQQLFCRIEAFDVEREFGEGNCTRFVGVEQAFFLAQQFASGVKTFVLDVTGEIANSSVEICVKHDDCPSCYAIRDRWYEVSYTCEYAKGEENGSIVSTFGETAGQEVRVTRIRQVDGPDLPPFPEYEQPVTISWDASWRCTGFEVGQGMASAIHNSHRVFLMDAGAGTPITRKSYAAGTLTRYGIRELVAGKEVEFILSHGDDDHWRLLRWDPGLVKSVKRFIVPKGNVPLAFYDIAIASKVFEISSHRTIGLTTASSIRLLRTKPAKPTSNNDCIVVSFVRDGVRLLFPGDCVYLNLACDNDPDVRQLTCLSYRAVVVPHHGDECSAKSVPVADSASSVAFFSAGCHLRYQHPTAISRKTHKEAGYTEALNKYPSGITPFILLE